MTDSKDGGPAFPLQLENRDQYHGSFKGMSLRDYFAGQALASGQCPHNSHEHQARAQWCIDEAGWMLAMLAQRAKAESQS